MTRLADAGWCEWCAGLGEWWEGPLGERVHVVCTYCRGQGEHPSHSDSQVST